MSDIEIQKSPFQENVEAILLAPPNIKQNVGAAFRNESAKSVSKIQGDQKKENQDGKFKLSVTRAY